MRSESVTDNQMADRPGSLPGRLAKLEVLPVPLLCFVVGLLWCAISFIFYAPSLFIHFDPNSQSRLRDLMSMAEHPLRRDLDEPILAYRLSVPVIAYVLGIRGMGVISITYAANVAFISTLFAALCTRTSRRVAFFGAGLIALSQAGQTGNTFFGYSDSVSHLCTAIGLLINGPGMALAVIVGLFSDERFALSLPFIVLWHLVVPSSASLQWSNAKRASFFIVVGLVLAIALRYCLTVGIIGPGLVLPATYNNIAANAGSLIGPFLKEPAAHIAAFVFAFRWLWALPFVLFMCSPSSRTRGFVGLTIAMILVGTVVVFWGGDNTRSLAFMFPAFVWMIPQISRACGRAEKIFVTILIASALTPQFNWDGSFKLSWVRPFPVVALRMLSGRDPAELIRALRHH